VRCRRCWGGHPDATAAGAICAESCENGGERGERGEWRRKQKVVGAAWWLVPAEHQDPHLNPVSKTARSSYLVLVYIL
jgi:hypothetical protein